MNAFILDAVLKEDDGVALLFSLLFFDAGDVFFVSLFVDALHVFDDGETCVMVQHVYDCDISRLLTIRSNCFFQQSVLKDTVPRVRVVP